MQARGEGFHIRSNSRHQHNPGMVSWYYQHLYSATTECVIAIWIQRCGPVCIYRYLFCNCCSDYLELFAVNHGHTHMYWYKPGAVSTIKSALICNYTNMEQCRLMKLRCIVRQTDLLFDSRDLLHDIVTKFYINDYTRQTLQNSWPQPCGDVSHCSYVIKTKWLYYLVVVLVLSVFRKWSSSASENPLSRAAWLDIMELYLPSK